MKNIYLQPAAALGSDVILYSIIYGEKILIRQLSPHPMLFLVFIVLDIKQFTCLCANFHCIYIYMKSIGHHFLRGQFMLLTNETQILYTKVPYHCSERHQLFNKSSSLCTAGLQEPPPAGVEAGEGGGSPCVAWTASGQASKGNTAQDQFPDTSVGTTTESPARA